MGFGNFIFFIIILVFAISAIKRAMEAASKEAQKNAPRGRDFEASPSEVEEFLRSLQQARRQQPQVQARPDRPQAPPAEGMRPRAAAPVEAPFWQEEGRQAVRQARPVAPAVRPTRVRRPRTRDVDDQVEELVAKEPVRQSPPPEAKPAVVTPPALKKIGLKEAVIWSEILGPPLSKRPPRGRGPAGR